MGLGDRVEALLETYSKCIELLRRLSSSGPGGSSRLPIASGTDRSAVPYGSSPASSDWDQSSALSRSLHTDRARIQKTYAARLSETGGRLHKGDSRSRSALRRIVRRLKDALARILGLASGTAGRGNAGPDGRPLLNYDALRALSNASCVNAIHAIDEASVRMSSRRTSVRSRSSRASSGRAPATSPSAGSSRQRPHSHHHGRALGSASSSSREDARARKHRSSAASDPRSKQQAREREGPSSSSPGAAGQARPGRAQRSSPGHHRGVSDSAESRLGGSSGGSTVVAHARPSASGRLARRVSMVSSSTASTRLGEIPEYKLRRRQAPAAAHADDAWAGVAPGYNIRPAYPMRPLRVPDVETAEQKPKKKLWGMFSRS